jgi:hypothetical protein
MSNTLSDLDKERIWIPQILFYNNPERNYILTDPLSILSIRREGKAAKKFNFQLNEFEEFKGNENTLFFENLLEMKLTCDLELHYYPFDTQHCFITVRLITIHHATNLLFHEGNLFEFNFGPLTV